MKFLYVTDVHDRFGGIQQILRCEPGLDFAFISGDLLYRTFYSDDNLYEFIELQQIFHARMRAERKAAQAAGNEPVGGAIAFPFDWAHERLAQPGLDADTEAKSLRFLELFELAAKNMQRKYAMLEGILAAYSSYPCWVLPGNYDMDLAYTALRERDAHRKVFRAGEVTFAAYGGAPVLTPGIPEKLQVHFEEGDSNMLCDPYRIFHTGRPDVIFVHQPAYGILDRLPSQGNQGSPGIRKFIDENSPSLCLSGHVHEDFGLRKSGPTICVNPSNFGKTESLFGANEGGYYAIVEMEGRNVAAVNLKRLRGAETFCVYRFEGLNGSTVTRKVGDGEEAAAIPGFALDTV